MEIKKFLGMRNTVSADRLKPGELASATSVDIDDSGKVMTRLGVSQVQAGSFHSLFADGDMCLVAEGSTLKRMNADHSLTTLAAFQSSDPVDMVRMQALVLMGNGTDTLMMVNGSPFPWGTPSPRGQPAAAITAGNLPPGDYMYAQTFLRTDGFESGTGVAGKISLPSGGGIYFSGLDSSTDSRVCDILVYISSADGKELFRALRVPVGTADAAYRGDGTDLGIRLETQFATEAPAASMVEIYNGCAYAIKGDMAYYSDPYAYERFRPRTQFLQLPGAITLWAAVNDGIFAATADDTYFLAGEHPQAMKLRKVFDFGAIPGTAVRTYAGVMTALEENERGEPGDAAVVWTSPQGVCVGMDGGRAVNLTGREYSFPAGARGRGLIKATRGFTSYKVALEAPGAAATNAYS